MTIKREITALADDREEVLRDLGGLALEMYRRGQIDGDLLFDKAEELAELESRMHELQRVLDGGAAATDAEGN